MCLCYATYSNLRAKQSKKNPLFTELFLNGFRRLLMPLEDFAGFAIASFSLFPELLNQQNSNSLWPPKAPQDWPCPPCQSQFILLSPFLLSDTAKFFPACRP